MEPVVIPPAALFGKMAQNQPANEMRMSFLATAVSEPVLLKMITLSRSGLKGKQMGRMPRLSATLETASSCSHMAPL